MLAVLVLHAAYPSAVERDLFRLLNDLPGAWAPTCRAVYAAGTLWAVALAVAAAVIGRRWRLARDLVVAGVAASAIAHALGAWVAGEGLSESFRAITRGGISPEFPLARIAIVVAIAATAGPCLTRPTRRIGQVFVLAIAVSALYLGTGLPNDVLGGIVLGLGVAAGVHLVFGSPGGRPTFGQVAAALAELGIHATGIRLAPKQPHGSTHMTGTWDGRRIFVRVIGRDENDTQFLAKLWRTLSYKDAGSRLWMTRLQQVEHEAYATLLAAQAGVRTSGVIVAAEAGPKAALLVEYPPPGRLLTDLKQGEVTDGLLVQLWREVDALHTEARVAHGALDTHHVVADGEVPAIVGFGRSVLRSAGRTSTDIVDLLVSTAAIVGNERAVAAASEGIGTGALANALPYMHQAALSPGVRSVSGRKLKKRMDDLRSITARAAGVEEPQLRELHRVSLTNLLLAVGTLVGVAGLLSEVGSPAGLWVAIRHADWWWALLAFALSMATNATYAVSLMGTVTRRLPLVQTTELQVSMSFANLAIPGVGGMASQVRFLQKQGVDLASAVASGGLLSTVANVVVSIDLLFIAVALSPDRFKTGDIPTEGIVRELVAAVLVAGVAVIVVKGIPRLHNAVMPPVARAWATVSAALRSPRQLSLLVLGSAGTNVLYGVCLLACLKAFDADLSFWTALALSTLFSQIASLIPIPGGGTAVSSVGISGALTGFGVPTEAAVAAVLLNQVVVSYLPAIPGWFETEHLLHHDFL